MITVISGERGIVCHICGNAGQPIVSYDKEDLHDNEEWPLQICRKCAGEMVTLCTVHEMLKKERR